MAFLKADFWKLSNIITLFSALARIWTKHTCQYRCTVLLSLMDSYSHTQSVKIIPPDRKHYILCSVCSCLWVYSDSVLQLSVLLYQNAGAENMHPYTCCSFTQIDSKIKCFMYDCWVALVKYGGWQIKTYLFFSTEGEGGLGWINSWSGVIYLSGDGNAGAVLLTLSFHCSFSLRSSYLFMFSYYLLCFCHMWNILHMIFVLFVILKDWF